jgi:aminopeptidase YwaD
LIINTVAFFNAEESDMQGSETFVQNLSEGERKNIVAHVNVDAPASGHELTAFTSGFADLTDFVAHTRTDWKLPLKTYEPPHLTSDHANFARAGIPAMRLATGWEDPSSMHRYMLTPADTIACVDPLFLKRAAYVTTILIASLCSAGRRRNR